MPKLTPQQIRSLRRFFEESQEEFAKRMNVSFATVNRWENGHSRPQAAQNEALKALLSTIPEPKTPLDNRLTLYKPDKTHQVFEKVEDVEIHIGRIVFSHSSHVGNGKKTIRYVTSFPFCFEEVMVDGEE